MATDPFAGDGGALYHTDASGVQTPTSGDISTTGTAVTGVGTVFNTDFPNAPNTQPTLIIASLPGGDVEARLVTAVASDLACTIGSAFSTDLPASTSFTFVECDQVPFVIETNGPDAAVNEINASFLGTGIFDAFIPGSINPGNIAIPMHLVPENTQQQLLVSRFRSRIILPYVIFFDSATTGNAIPHVDNGRAYARAYLSGNPLSQARGSTARINAALRVVGDFALEGGA